MASEIVQAKYDELEQIAQRFMQQSEQTNDLLGQVKAAMRPLESSWIGDAFDAFSGEMGADVLPGVNRLIELFSACSQVTTQVKTILEGAEEEAANVFRTWAIDGDVNAGGGGNGGGSGGGGNGGGSGGGGPFGIGGPLGGIISALMPFKNEIKNGFKLLKGLYDGFKIAKGLQFLAGSTYANQLRVLGTQAIKQLGGLSTHLTHFAYNPGAFVRGLASSNLTQSLVGVGGKGIMGRLPLIGNVIGVGMSGYSNWQTYQGQHNAVIKTATGTVMDSAVKIGLTAAGTYGGALAGGAIGTAIGGPIGAVVGAKIGGVIGGIAGSYVGDFVANSEIYKGAKDAVVNFVSDGADAVGNFVSGAADKVGGFFKSLNPFG